MSATPLDLLPDAARLSRRDVFRYFAAVYAAAAVAHLEGAENPEGKITPLPGAKGYGPDPDLQRIYQPGDLWPLTLTPLQKKTVTALADLILPADDLGPAASALRVPDYIDEWVSAPYESQQKTRVQILEGLAWLESEAKSRFQAASFADLSAPQQKAICDNICDPRKARAEHQPAAKFFAAFRGLAMGAYYATPDGWKAIGYVGNIPLATFDGPPREVLEKLGLEPY